MLQLGAAIGLKLAHFVAVNRRRHRRRVFWVIGVGVCLVLAPIIGLEVLYRSVISDLRTPEVRTILPLRAQQCLWVSYGNGTPFEAPSVHTWSAPLRLFLDRRAPAGVAPWVARPWAHGEKPARSLVWQLRWWAAEIWVSRNLSLEEQLSLLGEYEYLGGRMTGLSQGARKLFGVSVHELSDDELAMLCALAGGRFHDESTTPRLIERRDWLLKRLVDEGFWEPISE